jgi:hypothetical protein
LDEPREKSAVSDITLAVFLSTEDVFHGPHITNLLIFRLTLVIMTLHNRLCKRIFPFFAEFNLRWQVAP